MENMELGSNNSMDNFRGEVVAASNNDFWLDRNVFVTGGAGLLGSNLIKHLLSRKANVVALIRDTVPRSLFFKEGLVNNCAVVRGDLGDFSIVERSINEYEIDTIFHLGAQAIVGTANRSPLSTFESNIKGTWNILESARRSKLVTRTIIASSDKAYGSHAILPYTEKAPLQGAHPYDVSKTCADLLSRSYHTTYGIPVTVTRCGNFYGPGDLNWNRIVPDTIKSLFYNKSPIIRSDGTCIRDYIFIEDASDGYMKLAENTHREGINGEAFNFSTGERLTVLDMVKKITQLFPSNLEPTILNKVQGEIKHQYLSNEKSKALLNWKPKHTIDQSLVKTIMWYKSFLQNS